MANGKFKPWLRPDGLAQIEGWAHDGLTDEEIAHNMGISPTTLYTWEKRFPEILKSLKRGKDVSDYMVENALFKRAVGYTTVEHNYKLVDVDKDILDVKRREAENQYKLDHPEAKLQDIKDYAIKKVPSRERIELSQAEKEVAPDTTAAIFWLKNRRPDKWRDRKELEHSGNLNVTPFDGLNTDELEKHLEQLEGEPNADDD
ncbi:helix-turn-helix domain-containing protein [Lactiplantibacillus mudanjiangensis]|uniref:Uncharacterized protein n=1 Tax=Lactiplantibacillus mudanjiangensis TaxID=1296538 RepID=A0A660E4F5_9LACO|nr:helix-turn-helix domain-containing protein [Lactiplantibacillus mudanjiangensis]VDG23679.1 hypothetical protein [Lactobacillus brevis] [Lactiplantibacillus mudanjiangensis]VDG27822.1 hypothetical protein [Lactobacillus brevis] [Lactiplantibacillus mudanjiangensis]